MQLARPSSERGRRAGAGSLRRSRGSTARERGLEARGGSPGGEGNLTQAWHYPRRATDVGLDRAEELQAEEALEAAQKARRGSDEMLDVQRRLGADQEGQSCWFAVKRDF